MPEEIKKILEEYKTHTDAKMEEVKRHFDVVAENLESKIQVVAEQVMVNTEKISSLSEQVVANAQKLEEYDQRFDKIDDTLEVIKIDIEFIKNELQQRVSRDEFIFLEKRVSKLEAKVK